MHVWVQNEKQREIMGTATIGWYGPLIDLSAAASHIGDYVQLLVLVHRSTPVQYKMLNGAQVIRTDVQVGDDTRPFFSVSVWNKPLGSMFVAGDVVLLHNVRVTRFGHIVEARTVQESSLKCLVHPYESVLSSGVESLIENCRVGIVIKEKLRKVIAWVRRTEPTLHKYASNNCKKIQQLANWKIYKQTQSQECCSLSEVMNLTDSCKATFLASIGEMFLSISRMPLHEVEEERMFIRRRLCIMGDRNLAEDLICTGCRLCGTPLHSKYGSTVEQDSVPLYCKKSSNHIHVVSLIYRPYMLYVWDDSKCIPLLVTNKAAEILFGNIKAESVYSSYKRQTCDQMPSEGTIHREKSSCARAADQRNDTEKKSLNNTQEKQCSQDINFYSLWLILLKALLLLTQKNSPLKFKVSVDMSKDGENGRYELVSVSLPVSAK